ncbi:MAG: FCD domain-containing protein [Gammaproteobacteria bacterium]|nr:FCD domain-containing protein [Gammaproteobacteria bacterium]
MESLQPKDPQTIADRLSDELITSIVKGDIASGSKISEPDLARTYKVSRGPLREAIRRLEGLHLVARIPHVGARVVSLDPQQLMEIYQVREALEGMAARLACKNMTNDEITELKGLLDEHELSINQSEGSEYFQREGDFDFHYRIIQGSKNQRLVELLCSELYHLIRMYRFRSSQIHSRPHKALAEHRHICTAIEHRDGELAEILMRRHISTAQKHIEQQFQEEGE